MTEMQLSLINFPYRETLSTIFQDYSNDFEFTASGIFVNGNLKFLNSGKVKFLTCKFLRLILRSYVDANQEGVPHVERFVQRRFKHQRDCSTDRP